MKEFIENLKQIFSAENKNDILTQIHDIENEFNKMNSHLESLTEEKNVLNNLLKKTTESITKQLEVSQQLNNKINCQEERFRMLINYGNDIILVLDADGIPIFVSESVTKKLGYTVDEFLKYSIKDSVHPDDARGYKKAVVGYLRNPGENIHYEGRFKHRNGSWIWISSNGSNFLNNPVINGILINFHEITERKMAERAVVESEEKLSLIVDNNPDAIAVYRDGIIIFANQSAARLLKSENTEQLIGQPISQFIHPDYMENMKMRTKEASYRRDKTLKPAEQKIIRLDGSVIDVEVSTTCITYEGKKAFLSIVRDICYRKEMEQKLLDSEERYRAIVENIPDAVIVHRDGKIIYINNSGAKLFRAKSPGQLIGIHILSFIHSDSMESVKKRMKDSTSDEGIILMPQDEKYVGLDGSVIDVEAITAVVVYEGKKSFLTIARDISDRKRIERLREDTERIIRHDLKNPLNGILGFSQLLMETKDLSTENIEEWSSTIYNCGNKMLRMINHSLDLFKMEEGTYKLKYEEVNLLKIFDEIEKEFIPMLEEKSLVLICQINKEYLKWKDTYNLMGQELHLKSLFENLIKNAIEASPPEKRISININPRGNIFHEIDIHNSGVIPESIRDRFFDRYTTAGKSNGTGIGTYSAYLIARTHRGNITFSSSKEEGTHVTVFLPKNVPQESCPAN